MFCLIRYLQGSGGTKWRRNQSRRLWLSAVDGLGRNALNLWGQNLQFWYLGYEEAWELPKGSVKTIEVRSGKTRAKSSKQRTYWAQRIRGRREVKNNPVAIEMSDGQLDSGFSLPIVILQNRACGDSQRSPMLCGPCLMYRQPWML